MLEGFNDPTALSQHSHVRTIYTLLCKEYSTYYILPYLNLLRQIIVRMNTDSFSVKTVKTQA